MWRWFLIHTGQSRLTWRGHYFRAVVGGIHVTALVNLVERIAITYHWLSLGESGTKKNKKIQQALVLDKEMMALHICFKKTLTPNPNILELAKLPNPTYNKLVTRKTEKNINRSRSDQQQQAMTRYCNKQWLGIWDNFKIF